MDFMLNYIIHNLKIAMMKLNKIKKLLKGKIPINNFFYF